MHLIRLLPALALAFALVFSCSPAPQAVPQREVVLELQGLDCAGCAQTVRAALAQVPGVRAVEVDHEALRANVTCAETTGDEALVQAVAGAGEFRARPLGR